MWLVAIILAQIQNVIIQSSVGECCLGPSEFAHGSWIMERQSLAVYLHIFEGEPPKGVEIGIDTPWHWKQATKWLLYICKKSLRSSSFQNT